MSSPSRPRIPARFVLGIHDAFRGEDPHAPSSPHQPPVDVVDDGTGWRLVFEVPGCSSENVSIEVKGRVVVVRGERRPTEGERGRFLRVERAAGPFERALELPEDPDAEKARASYADGLLILEIPRRVAPKSRTIPIKSDPGRGRGTKV